MPAIWQVFLLTAIEEIGKGAAHSLEHPARVIPRFVKELFDFPLHDVLVGVLIFIAVRLLNSIALILDLVHVPALVHALDARHPAVIGLDVNSPEGLPRPVFQRDNPDRIPALVRPQLAFECQFGGLTHQPHGALGWRGVRRWCSGASSS